MSKFIYHYVYRITNLIENRHYYGSRSCKCIPQLDLGIQYFSSSSNKNFIKDQKQNPQNYHYKIIRIFLTRTEATSFEIRLHNKFDVGQNLKFYNKVKQTSIGFCTEGLVSVKDKTGKFYSVSIDDPRYLSGELIHMLKNFVTVKDKNNKCFNIPIDDPRYISGELTHVSKGKITVKDNTGKYFKVSVDDPKIKSGELNYIFTGCNHSIQTKEKMSQSAKYYLKDPTKNSQYGTMWINNGTENKKIKKTDPIPPGFIKGRKLSFPLLN